MVYYHNSMIIFLQLFNHEIFQKYRKKILGRTNTVYFLLDVISVDFLHI